MVRIAICEGLWGKVSIIQCGTQKKLWEGKSRDLAEFALPDGLQEAEIAIIWGILQTPNVKTTVQDEKSYELIFRMKPFAAEYSLIPQEEGQMREEEQSPEE